MVIGLSGVQFSPSRASHALSRASRPCFSSASHSLVLSPLPSLPTPATQGKSCATLER